MANLLISLKIIIMKPTLKHIILLLSMLPVAQMWAKQGYDFEAGGIYYSITGENTVEVSPKEISPASSDYSGDISIPPTVVYEETTYNVTGIGMHAFRYCSGVTSVSLPNSIVKIGDYAFRGCSLNSSFVIPENVTYIGSIFDDSCKITELTLPFAGTTLTSGNLRSLFSTTNYYPPATLTKVTVTNCTRLNTSAFSGCNHIKEVILPDNLKVISSNAFAKCYGIHDFEIPETVTTIEDGAFRENYSLASVSIPESVTSIGATAFYGCSKLTSITIPSKVTAIEFMTFQDCTSLTSISLSEGIISIGLQAFQNCINLPSIDIPQSVRNIEMYAFKDCQKITEITIPEGVSSIEENVFLFCYSLANVTIPNSVTNIKKNAFRYCGLTSVDLPQNLQSIGNGAFSGCGKLGSVDIPENVTTIGIGVFENCTNLTSVTFPSNINSIPETTFQKCSNLASFNIPQQVTDIGMLAFDGCSKLTSLTIPASVTNIADYYTFNGCTGLEEVIVEWQTPLSVVNNIYSGVNLSQCTLKVPQGTRSLYQNAPVWQDFGQIIEYENSTSSANGFPQTDKIRITADKGAIIVENAPQAAIRIYNVNGTCCASVSSAAVYEFFPLPAGIYIVQAGEVIRKIALK